MEPAMYNNGYEVGDRVLFTRMSAKMGFWEVGYVMEQDARRLFVKCHDGFWHAFVFPTTQGLLLISRKQHRVKRKPEPEDVYRL